MSAAEDRPGVPVDAAAAEQAPRTRLLHAATTELMAARLTTFFTAGLLAVALLGAAVGAGAGALRAQPRDLVLLFAATTMALVGCAAGIFALVSLRALRRDALTDLQHGRPPRARRARTPAAAWTALACGIAAGAVLAALLWAQSAPLALGVAWAGLCAGAIGPAGLAAQRRAEAALAAALDDPGVRDWFAQAAPGWLHAALDDEAEAARSRRRRQRRLFGASD